MTSEPATLPRRRGPLVALLAANAVSMSGNVAALVAIPWFVLQTTGSAARMGVSRRRAWCRSCCPVLRRGPRRPLGLPPRQHRRRPREPAPWPDPLLLHVTIGDRVLAAVRARVPGWAARRAWRHGTRVAAARGRHGSGLEPRAGERASAVVERASGLPAPRSPGDDRRRRARRRCSGSMRPRSSSRRPRRGRRASAGTARPGRGRTADELPSASSRKGSRSCEATAPCSPSSACSPSRTCSTRYRWWRCPCTRNAVYGSAVSLGLMIGVRGRRIGRRRAGVQRHRRTGEPAPGVHVWLRGRQRLVPGGGTLPTARRPARGARARGPRLGTVEPGDRHGLLRARARRHAGRVFGVVSASAWLAMPLGVLIAGRRSRQWACGRRCSHRRAVPGGRIDGVLAAVVAGPG